MIDSSKYRPIFIIIASGLFVTVIVVSGLVLFYPREATEVAAVDTPQSAEAAAGVLFDPYQYLNDIEIIGADIANVIPIAPRADRSEVAAGEQRPADSPSRSAATEAEPRMESATATLHSQRNGAQMIESPRSAPATAAPATPMSASTTATAKRTQSPPSPTRHIASSATSAPPLPSTLYWIQLFSSSSHERAEAARTKLSQYQLEGVIAEHDIDGTRYYRLRVGPYYNQNEADKFLAWFNQSAIFDAGYVVQVAHGSGR